MAVLSVTAANVVPSTDATKQTAQFGEAVTQGQLVYRSTADNKWYKLQCDGTALQAGEGTTTGIALSACSANQWGSVQTGGSITIGATVVAGTVYYANDTAGSIGEFSDLGSTDRIFIVGYGTSTTVIKLLLISTGVAVA